MKKDKLVHHNILHQLDYETEIPNKEYSNKDNSDLQFWLDSFYVMARPIDHHLWLGTLEDINRHIIIGEMFFRIDFNTDKTKIVVYPVIESFESAIFTLDYRERKTKGE